MINDAEARYAIQEGDFPLGVPSPWEDQSVNVLRLAGDGHAAASLVVSRDMLPVGVTVTAYIEQELHRLKKDLPEFEVKGRTPVSWPDQQGQAILTRWRSESGQMDQVTACRVIAGQRILIFTATHASPMPTGVYQTVMTAISGFRPRSASAESEIGAVNG